MKVILLQDVKSLGKKGDIVNASDAYARNVLFPKKQAVEANSSTMNDLKLQTAHAQKVEAENLANAKQLAEDLKDKKVVVKIKAGKDGKTFGSVSTKEISQAVKEQLHLELDKKKMQLNDPIKALGTYEVNVKLHTQVTAVLHVQVLED
jgi:large subunit ribosomal protein L9